MVSYLKIVIVMLLVLVGVYCYCSYRDSDKLSDVQRKRYKMLRYTGIAVLLIAVSLCIYFYCTEPKSQRFKATMGDACKDCELYTRRHRDLRPYSVGEYKLLQKHARGCRECSDQCTQILSGAKKLNIKADTEFLKKECISITESALKANRELGRLTEKLRGKQIAYWRANPTASVNIFPPIPK